MCQRPSDLGQKPWVAVKRGLFKTKAKRDWTRERG